MSNPSTSSASTPGAPGDVPPDASTEPSAAEKPKMKNRQGHKSKKDKAEKHRYKKNQDWMQNKSERLFKKYSEPLPTAVDELRPQEVSISKPTRCVR